MFNHNHPSHHPETSGRARRYVKDTHIIRPIRLDSTSDDALSFLRRHLSIPHDCRDLASVSMVCRRALRLYKNHVVYHFNDPVKMEQERQAVRDLTRPPGRKRKPKVVV